MKHHTIRPHSVPILASTNPRIGWGVILGFAAAALLLALMAIASGTFAPFFTTAVLAGVR
ncbi:hypothetical protein [Lentzea cavernae]|uniref:ABC transporter permease n=1 Tax=Lentzea cavernae TaxID=2020703 RepID=A0ABQ3MSR3_9PSEU|nr:hypothetical protein [Lentzea cavernae]GHH57506.1 hypothetical protein GCM10017774_77110 [Lentzea cavernae]